MKVTNEELEKLGIYYVGNKMKPNKYFCEASGIHHNINKNYNIKQILDLIITDVKYEAHAVGVEEGKLIRSEEFKNLINNEV